MAKLLFKLRNVPDDEAQDVRELLDQHSFEYFETSPGNWGISMPAIWLQDESDFEQARRLIDDYQQLRSQRMREEYESRRQHGEARTLWHSFVENPSRFILYVGLAALVLFLSLRFFLSF